MEESESGFFFATLRLRMSCNCSICCYRAWLLQSPNSQF
nr:MAG TPA: hypothetical protein [Caudoviricetes sp.]